MTLLAPMTGVVAAALVLPLIVVLYFLKLRRRPLRVSSTLLWEQTVRDLQVNAPFRWLRVSLLLLLQLLGAGCLIVAAARPALQMHAPTSQRVVVLIDRSASMNARDGTEGEPAPSALPPEAATTPPTPTTTTPGSSAGSGLPTRLDEARAKALQLIESTLTSGGGQVMVIAFAARPEALCGLTQDRATLREAIASVRPSDQPGDLAAAMTLAATLAIDRGNEDRAAIVPTVFLISDGGVGGPGTSAATSGAGLDVRFVRVGPGPEEPVNNMGIVAVNARRDHEDPGTIRVFARVQNSGRAARATRVELTLDGRAVGSQMVTAPGTAMGVPDAGEARVPIPGEAPVSFEIRTTSGGALGVSLPPGDVLAEDDQAWIVLAPALRARIVVRAPQDEASVDPFLISALRAIEPESLTVLPSGVPDPAGADLIVYDRVTPPAAPRVASLSIGAGMPALGVTMTPAPKPAGGGGTSVAETFIGWKRNHPLLRYVGLETILVDPPLRMSLPATSAERPVTPLAEGAGGALVAMVEQAGVRRVFVAFELQRSNWGPHYSFPLFVSNAVEYLTVRGQAQAGRWWSTTAPVSVHSAAARVELVSPAGVIAAQASGGEGERLVSLGIIERAGLYECRGAIPTEGLVAVNLCEPGESLAWTSQRVALAGSTVRAAGEGESGGAGGAGGAGPREIWSWFIAAAIGVLSVEWFLYAWQMRT